MPENTAGNGMEVTIGENEEMITDKEAGADTENPPAVTGEPAGNEDSRPMVAVNTREEEVFFDRTDDIDPLRALHRCVSDGQNVYLAYNEADLYVMPVGADRHSRADIDNPEKLKVCNVAIDTYGKLHLLMAAPDYEEWYVWCLNKDYQTEKILDVSAYFKTKHIPLWFLVDKDGTYYFQWALERNGIILDGEGNLKYETTPQSLGLNWIYEAAVGKDGQIYLLYRESADRLGVGVLDVKKGSMGTQEVTFSFPDEETFMTMSAGTDTTLLLFSPNSGVWACDTEKRIFTNRATLSDIGFAPSMEYWPLTFIPDGRLLVMAQFADTDATKEAEIFMKYIPAGK